MSRVPALTRMALRELFISYRMVPTIGLPIAAGVAASLVPAEYAGLGAIAGAGHVFALGLAVGVPLIGAIAAATLASERRRGTLAWLAVRAVPRSAVVTAWLAAFGFLLIVGIGFGAVATWLAALERAETPLDPGPFIVAAAAALCVAFAVVAAGLALGSVFTPWRGALLAALLGWAIFGVAVLVPGADALAFARGWVVLNQLDAVVRPIGDAVWSAGLSLALGGVLLALASAATERADL